METKSIATLNERLSEYLSQLTPATAVKLATGLERERMRGTQGLPYDIILSSLRPLLAQATGPRPGLPDPVRQFCRPFEDLLIDGPRNGTQRWRIGRASIRPVWRWLQRDLLPDTLPDIARHMVEHTLNGDRVALGAAIEVMHASCSGAILAALETVRRDKVQRQKLESQLGGELALDDARIMAEMLAIAPHLLSLQQALPGRIREFNDSMIAAVAKSYETLRDNGSEYAIYIPLAAMQRLEESWQILRLVRRLAGFGNDAGVARSGLAPLGELFLSEMEEIVQIVELRRPGRSDLDEMLILIHRFAQISKGFVGEIDIRRCSEWGHRILAARARLSSAIAEEISRFENDLARTLPLHQIGNYGRNGPRRPDITRAPDFDRAGRMAASIRFLEGCCHAGETIGVQAHCQSVHQQIENYLVAYEDGLVEEIRRSKGCDRANAQAYLDIIVGFREALGPGDAAMTLRRRGQVAAQG